MRNASADWANVLLWAIFPVIFNNCCKGLIHARLQLQIAAAIIKDADRRPNNLSADQTKPSSHIQTTCVFSRGWIWAFWGILNNCFHTYAEILQQVVNFHLWKPFYAGHNLRQRRDSRHTSHVHLLHLTCSTAVEPCVCQNSCSGDVTWISLSQLWWWRIGFPLQPEGRISASAAQSTIQALPLADGRAVTS